MRVIAEKRDALVSPHGVWVEGACAGTSVRTG